MKPSIFAEPSGDACDQYHRYLDDIELVKSLGFNTYRFSVEWARIEPERGFFSRAELEHYRPTVEPGSQAHARFASSREEAIGLTYGPVAQRESCPLTRRKGVP